MKGIIKEILLSAVIVGCFTGLLIGGVYYFAQIERKQSRELLEQSVRRAATECYAIEGAYPLNVNYLEKRYGVAYDKEKYRVEYGYSSQNVMPTIIVYEK